MDYYAAKRELAQKINNLVSENPGKSIQISDLEIKFSIQYGFGRSAIIKALQPYIKSGAVSINKDTIEVSK